MNDLAKLATQDDAIKQLMFAKTPSECDKLLEYLKYNFDGYPYSDMKDRSYFRLIFNEFGDLDILEEMKQFHAWVLDQSDYKKIQYRSRFRTWLKMARRFKAGKSIYHA